MTPVRSRRRVHPLAAPAGRAPRRYPRAVQAVVRVPDTAPVAGLDHLDARHPDLPQVDSVVIGGRNGISSLRTLIEQLATRDRPSGYHESTYFESLDDPDLLIDIGDRTPGRPFPAMVILRLP